MVYVSVYTFVNMECTYGSEKFWFRLGFTSEEKKALYNKEELKQYRGGRSGMFQLYFSRMVEGISTWEAPPKTHFWVLGTLPY